MHGDGSGERMVRIEALGERLAPLRLCGADALAQMQLSLARLGQLSAIAVFAGDGGGLEVADGFKRLRAARALGWSDLRVHTLAIDTVEVKVAIGVLNDGYGLTELEQAWLVRSLYREDGLRQPEIARRLGRDKSWVSRRLMIAEALDDAVQADVRLGLLSARAAAALARLPRGNQRPAAQVVTRTGMTFRQIERLVDELLGCGAGTGPWRSPIPEQADHRFRSKPITDSGACRSLNASAGDRRKTVARER